MLVFHLHTVPLAIACIMEAKIENKLRRCFISEIREVDKSIVKAMRVLGYDQPADVTIRNKTLGLYIHF